MVVLIERDAWEAAQDAHADRADRLTAGHRARRQDHRAHPVEDFLFQYYNYSPARLRRWHPGPGLALAGAAGMPRAAWRFYRTLGTGAVLLDTASFLTERATAVAFTRELLSRTLSRPAFTGCFGLHEWAMVYRAAQDQVRHRTYPLRLSPSETDAVVEAHHIRCSHFDAFRFFTPDALSRNALQPTRDRQVELEQPGCLHAGMDLYKWAHKLHPLVPSDVVLDAFELAREIRSFDMRASPYDLADLGYPPISIETPQGKSEYAVGQRDFAERSNDLRRRLLDVLDQAAGFVSP